MVKIYKDLVIYIGKTREEAMAKKAEFDENLPVENVSKKLSFFFLEILLHI